MSKPEADRASENDLRKPEYQIRSTDDAPKSAVSLVDEANLQWLDEQRPSRTPLSEVSDSEEINRREDEVDAKLAEIGDE